MHFCLEGRNRGSAPSSRREQGSTGLQRSTNRRIRFSAEKPRAGKQSTGLFAWTALSNPPSKYPNAEKDQSERIGLFLEGLAEMNLRNNN